MLPANGVIRMILALAVMAMAASGAVAQSPQGTSPAVPPPATGESVTMPPEPAQPDTALAILAGPESWPLPAKLRIVAGEPVFGDLVTVVIDLPGVGFPATADSLVTLSDWLVWTDAGETAEETGWRRLWRRVRDVARPPAVAHRELVDALPDADEAGTTRVVRVARVLRSGPCRLVWAEAGVEPSAVVDVASRLETGDAAAPIRDPRALGWTWLNIALAVVAVAVIAWLVGRLRSAKRRRLGPVDTPIPAPAWLETALALLRLQSEKLPARGEGRRHLDRLAQLVRGYVARRYGIGAAEMTAPEIEASLRARGYRRPEFGSFTKLLAECDRRRYQPGGVDAARCRKLGAVAITAIAAVRIEARFAPVPADLAVEAQKAWAALTAGIPEGERDLSPVADAGGEA